MQSLVWEALLNYAKLEWNRTLAIIRTFPQLEHNCLHSFDKTWGGQFILYNRDYLDVRWSYRLPKLQCPVGMRLLSPWLCVCQPLRCFVFFFSLQRTSFHLCPKKKKKRCWFYYV
jgi:hypothetical protein